MGKPKKPETFGIYVRNFSAETKQTDLVKYFLQFGNVVWVHFRQDYLLLDFPEKKAVDKVMAEKNHFLNGKRLYIRHKLSNVKVKINEKKIIETLQQSIIEGLQGAKDFNEELLFLIQKLQPNQLDSCNKQNSLRQDFIQILSKRFSKIQIFQFGSTMTGLGFDCTSDVDVYLSNVKYDNDDEELRLLYLIKSMLVSSGKFGNTFLISTSKIPIIRCLHLATKIPCDINIKSMFGVWNSKLIYYYMGLDPMIKRCMVALKYWAKHHEITKKSLLFTNYAFVMLFVFFLQDVFHFPCVHKLQQHLNLIQIDGWTVEFVPESYCPSINNPLDVLKQFFQYYWQFNYKEYIIVPYLGQKFPRQDFAQLETLPKSCFAYRVYMLSNLEPKIKLTGAICLQDPIEHFRNITTAVTDSTLDQFVVFCKLGLEICLENDKNVLLKLLTKPISLEETFTIKLSNRSLSTVIEFLKVSLGDILCFTLTEDKSNPFTLNCKAKTDMWSSRKALTKQFHLYNEADLIKRELAVTEKLKEAKKNCQSSRDILKLKLTLEACHEGVSVTVQKLLAYKKSFKAFEVFFTAKIQFWFQTYQKNTRNCS